MVAEIPLRLVNVQSGLLSEHNFDSPPAYLAVSHAWKTNLFPSTVPFAESDGARALRVVTEKKHPGISHCWVDTICIRQSDDEDKQRQIPLMGQIFQGAVAVTIILGSELNLHQEEIDRLSDELQGACWMSANETWLEDGPYWADGPGRQLVVKAMNGLETFTRDEWGSRIWTLQEFVLARSIVWIGSDHIPVHVRDILFEAIPNICDVLSITECIGGKFSKLFSHFLGMVNCRLKKIDRTRIMELVGNRSATMPEDEVYGVMAASGVNIENVSSKRKEDIWRRWCEQAIREGHLRWAFLPAYVYPQSRATQSPQSRNCAFPDFYMRHKSSSASQLDTIEPLGLVKVDLGSVTMSGRWAGFCALIRHLGGVHENPPNQIHRELTLVLFANGSWPLAVKIASAFGAGRYKPYQSRVIAHVLQSSFSRAIRAIEKGEDGFRPNARGRLQKYIWTDFVQLQMSQMPAMNDGEAYLVKINNSIKSTYAIAVFGEAISPNSRLDALHFEANGPDGRSAIMIVQRPSEALEQDFRTRTGFSQSSLHKVAMTLPVSITSKLRTARRFGQHVLDTPALEEFCIGGDRCAECARQWTSTDAPSSPAPRRAAPTLADLKRVERALLIASRASEIKIRKKRRSVLRHKRRSI